MDIGCGQGRDALFIARLGHAVVGVDLSPTGIAEMCAIADEEDLNINGIAADITEFVPEGMFDVILFDRTLHMLPKAPRLTVLSKLIAHVAPNGWVLIADEKSNMDGFKEIFAKDSRTWSRSLDTDSALFMHLG